MRDECEQDPTVNSMPRGLKYSAGHNHDDNLDSVVLVGVVGVSNASSLGRLSLVKSTTSVPKLKPLGLKNRFFCVVCLDLFSRIVLFEVRAF